LELRYPFAPQSRKFFETIPVEEGLASREVVGQAENRLLNALGRAKYEHHISELIEFSSFFAAALIASQEGFLASKFSKKEAERAREFFVREGGREKATVMNECFGTMLELAEEERDVAEYAMPFESYLALATRYELTKVPKWKLVRQALVGGTVFLNDNLLNDLFADCAQGAILEGVKNLRRGVFPRQLQAARANIIQYVPVQRPRGGKSYAYVEDLLKHPALTEGRKRLTWLVLAPWYTNVKQLSDEEAVEMIQNYVSAGGGLTGARRFIQYNVRRARRLGLMPPTLDKLKTQHPDLYALLPREVVATGAEERKSSRKRSPR
jgi:hypothetical protein